MDITSPLFLAILANGPVKLDGYTYFLYGGNPGNANPIGDLKNPGLKEKSKPRIVSRKPAKCGKSINGQSEIYRYGGLKPEKGVLLKAIPYSTRSMAGACNRAKAYGHSRRSASPWEH